MKGKTPAEIRKTFNIREYATLVPIAFFRFFVFLFSLGRKFANSDYTAEEEMEIRREYSDLIG